MHTKTLNSLNMDTAFQLGGGGLNDLINPFGDSNYYSGQFIMLMGYRVHERVKTCYT